MLSESEAAELRSLQERAYGRDGELSAEDALRLHELELTLRPEVMTVVAEPAEVSGPATLSGPATVSDSATSSASGSVSTPEPVDGFDAAPSPKAEASAPPRSRRRLAFGAAGVLLVGLGVGWVLWGWNSAEFALATTHSEQRAELEASGDFDPGTVAAMSENHGVVIWRAERDQGDQDCVIVTTSSMTQSGCATMEDSSMGGASATITVPEGDALEGQTLSAYLLLSVTGEVVPTVQIWDQGDSNWESQFTEEELEAIARLEAAGFEATSLNILGYDGDTPVWTSWGNEMCVIVESDDGVLEGCSSLAETPPTELVVSASVNGISTQYIVRQTEMRGPQLTVVKLPELQEFEVDVGDKIEIELDDKTG